MYKTIKSSELLGIMIWGQSCTGFLNPNDQTNSTARSTRTCSLAAARYFFTMSDDHLDFEVNIRAPEDIAKSSKGTLKISDLQRILSKPREIPVTLGQKIIGDRRDKPITVAVTVIILKESHIAVSLSATVTVGVIKDARMSVSLSATSNFF